MYKNDTICGIATGLGKSAIGMIRVSGPEAIKVCSEIFRGKKKIEEMETFTAAFGKITDGNDTLDEAIVLVMKAPHTYTTEDVVEINLHGGTYVVKRVLGLLIDRGVRVAEPGEFTKRAFLGGRIDMTEAEAVMDVINAETDKALRASVNQLTGRLRDKVKSFREKILYQSAYIESALDDPENYSLDGFAEKLKEEIEDIRSDIKKLLSTSEEGRIIREGISTAIVGRPNVGKSSVLNMILEEERAIVTDIEGTTRDTLEEYVNIGGIVLRLIDTAGIRETEDIVERIGVDRARDTLDRADLVLLILDGSESLSEDDREIMSEIEGKTVITLINKSDKQQLVRAEDLPQFLTKNLIEVSARTGEGLDRLKALITELFMNDNLDYNDQIYITNARHKAGLVSAGESLEKVLDSIEAGLGEDFYTIDLMAAYESLGEIIGETLEDDLADKIFSEFCMGK